MVAGEFAMLAAFAMAGLLVATIGAFIGHEVWEKECRWLALGALGLAWGSAVFLWLNTGPDDLLEVVFYHWAGVGSIKFSAGMRLDPLAATTLIGMNTLGWVTGVFCMVQPPHKGHVSFFLGQLCFIMAALWLMILADGFGLLLAGWELAGIGAYLLSGWRYPRFIQAAGNAFLMQRLGGGLLLLGCIDLAAKAGSLNFAVLADLDPGTTGLATTGWFFLGAAALQILTVFCRVPIHASAPFALPLVAFVQTALAGMAGIYLLVRGHLFLQSAGLATDTALWAGMAVALLAAVVALAKRDVGQVLAYSTLSQCGLLVAALGLGAYQGAVYHMWMHAVAKVLLFLLAGRAILAADGVADLGRMGGLAGFLPYSYGMFLIGAAALAGVPPLGGFWSQMQIVLPLYGAGQPWLWGGGCVVILLTAVYAFRLVGRLFWGRPYQLAAAGQGQELRPLTAMFPLGVLVLVCLLGGLWPLWPGAGLGLGRVQAGGRLALLELGAIVAALVLVGLVLAWAIYARPQPQPPHLRFLRSVALHGFYLEQGVHFLGVRPVLWAGRFLRDFLENILLEGIGFGGILLGSRGLGWVVARFHNGRIDSYVLATAMGLLGIVAYLFWDVE